MGENRKQCEAAQKQEATETLDCSAAQPAVSGLISDAVPLPQSHSLFQEIQFERKSKVSGAVIFTEVFLQRALCH